MKISILWSSLTPYVVPFFRHLAQAHDVTIQLVYRKHDPNAPFNAFDLSFAAESLTLDDDVENAVHAFSPDAILMSGWRFDKYRRAARSAKKQGTLVVAGMGNQWRGTLRQRLAVLGSSIYLKPYIDTIWAAGDRQALFAKSLGYRNSMYGFNCANSKLFYTDRSQQDRPNSFLFVGRLVEEKGIDDLVQAYRSYRADTRAPWSLDVFGRGPLARLLDDVEGINYRGFAQPDDLPAIYRRYGAFVLPSHYEPWGVVIHEAALTGMPIIAAQPVGAITWFVRDGINGSIVPEKAPDLLAAAMHSLSSKTGGELEQMSKVSQQLGQLWTTEKHAQYFLDQVQRRLLAKKH